MAHRLTDLVVILALCAVTALLVTALEGRPVLAGDATGRATVCTHDHPCEPFP